MIKDECILVDEQDRITGHANKYTSHRRAGMGGSWGQGSCTWRNWRALPVPSLLFSALHPFQDVVRRACPCVLQVQPLAATRAAAPSVQCVPFQL
jgi:hypothetical protein